LWGMNKKVLGVCERDPSENMKRNGLEGC
jgi:hypothetical protein